MSLTRRWLEDRGFLEVETPVLHPIPGGALAEPFTTHHNALDQDLYLRIAPELYLKRLVVGGFEKVFEIGRVFRNEGMSTRHNPEFTMLELYQAYADYHDMMALTEELVAHLAIELCGTHDRHLRRPRARPVGAVAAGHDGRAHRGADRRGRRRSTRRSTSCGPCATTTTCRGEDATAPGKLLLELYEKTTEATLWEPVFVIDYPQEVSPLARPHREPPGWSSGSRPIVAGRELCNAFSELTDPDDQRARFEDQARQRAAGDDEAMAVDEDYLRALELRPAAHRRPRHRHRPPGDAAGRRRHRSATSCCSRRCAPRRAPTSGRTEPWDDGCC